MGDEKDRRKGEGSGEEDGESSGVFKVGGVVVVLDGPATVVSLPLVRGLGVLPCCLSLALRTSRPLPAPT